MMAVQAGSKRPRLDIGGDRVDGCNVAVTGCCSQKLWQAAQAGGQWVVFIK